MALTAAAIISRAARQLVDPGYIRWSQEELLDYLNDGRLETTTVRPDLYSLYATVSLVEGTRQAVPADGARLLDLIRNTNGTAVRVIEREWLDAARPGWQTDTAASAISQFCYDERDPRAFYVYPPALAGIQVDLLYTRLPDPVTVDDMDEVQLTQEGAYAPALVDYVVYRALAKDSEVAANLERAAAYYSRYTASLSPRTDLITSPNTANKGGDWPRTAAG